MSAGALQGQEELRRLSARLKAAGTGGRGLSRELVRAIGDAGQSLAQEIGSAGHLRPYLPDRYAEVLAGDLMVTASKRGVANPAVTVVARGRVRRRQVKSLEAGRLRHPVYGRPEVPRRGWPWVSQAVYPHFFTDPCKRAAPRIREDILAAMHGVGQKITGA